MFATNLVAIQVASSTVLYFFGYHRVSERNQEDKGFLRRLIIDVSAFIVLAVFLYFRLSLAVERGRFETEVKTTLEQELFAIPGAYLSETRFLTRDDREVVVAVVRVPNSITPEQTAVLEAKLSGRGSKPIELHVRSLLTKETTSKGYLHEISPQAGPVEAIRPDWSPDDQPGSPIIPRD